ncbi:MAG: endonuclease domain-containing protein [Burkholderiales bacterium]
MRNRTLQSRASRLRKNSTDTERFLWQRLRLRQLAGFKFRRQVPIAKYIVDFACVEAKLVIELDGGQHPERTAYDHSRDAIIQAQGFRVLRFWDNEVFETADGVVERILAELMSGPCPAPTLSLPRTQGRESMHG